MNPDILVFRQIAYRLYGNIFAEFLEETGLTQNEIDILLFFANNPEHNTAAEAVRLRGLTKSHVSASVERLVSRGLLRRRTDEINRHICHLSPTEEAAPLLQRGRACQQRFSEILLDGIPEEDCVRFAETIDRMIRNARDFLG